MESCDNGNVFETESVHSGMILLQNRSQQKIFSLETYFETESVHSGMILLQNRSPGRISSADLSKTFLGQL